jgi:hypothetical protein
MRVQNKGMLLELFRHFVLDIVDLLLCRFEGFLEPVHLFYDLVLAYEILIKDLSQALQVRTYGMPGIAILPFSNCDSFAIFPPISANNE